MSFSALDRAQILALYGHYLTSMVQRNERVYNDYCPFCADVERRLFVDSTEGTWHCFSCGAIGDMPEFISRMEHVDHAQAEARLRAIIGLKSEVAPARDRPEDSAARKPAPHPPPHPQAPPPTAGSDLGELLNKLAGVSDKGLMGVIFRSGRDGYEAVRSGGDSPFEEKELLRMAGFMSQTLSMGDTLLGEPGLRGFLSVSGRLHGEGVQMVWRAVEAGDFDAILLIVASPASMKLSQHALETWLKQHGLDT